MHTWINLLTDSTPICSIFGNDLPDLQRVDLHEIILHRDGPRVSLRFDLTKYPTNPPEKWIAGGFNRVQLRLLAVGVQEISIKGWQTQCKITLKVFGDGAFIRLRSQDGEVKIELLTESLLVDSVTAYCNE